MNPLKFANPVSLTKGVFGLAGTAVGLAGAVTRETAHVLRAGLQQVGKLDEPDDQTERTGADSAAGGPNVAGPTTAAAAEAAVTDLEGAPPGPNVVPVEPHAPEQPPVDVVGAALAAEALAARGEQPDGAGLAHEPRGASRDEEHGDAALQRAEADEIAEEAAAALDGDLEPQEHLTAPLLDPADAKAIASEMHTMRAAADPDNVG